MVTADRVYDLFMIGLFVFVPEICLVTCLVTMRSASVELSHGRFFEPAKESVSWQLLGLTAALFVLGFLG